MRKYNLMTLFLAIAVSSTAVAQDGDSLTLGTVYRALAAESPRVKAALAVARAAEARVGPARRPPDPVIQVGFMNRSLPGFGLDPSLGMTQIQVMQMVPVAGKLGLSGRAGQADADGAAARAEAMWWEQRAMAAMAFYDLYVAERSREVATATLGLLRDIAVAAENMYRVGQGRQADVLRAQVEIARMQEEQLRMTAMRDAAAARLNGLLGRAADTPIPPVQLARFPDQVSSGDSLQQLALRARSMIRAGEEDLAASEARERLAGRESWPDLQVGLTYGQRPMSGGTDRMVSLMVGVSLPIFGRQRGMQREATAMREMAAADLSAMRAETGGQVGELFTELDRSRRLAALYRTTILPQAEATAASAMSAYQVGSVDLMTLLDARMDVNRYRQELARLEGEQGVALAGLEALVAGELFNPDGTASAVSLQ